ncbi:MAG: hypothetical protein M0C28_42130 [Candidatus Moduliflexus flocculans]|nr:hypothetical protein [Candidatus Moduliflexus flocculans]
MKRYARRHCRALPMLFVAPRRRSRVPCRFRRSSRRRDQGRPRRGGPRVDGLLDDPVWQSVPAITGFRMVEPRPGEDPSERTEARVLYDGAQPLHRRLLLRQRARPHLGQHHGPRQRGRAAAIWDVRRRPRRLDRRATTVVRVLLDPFQDKRNAYVFFVNPRGARGEGLAYAGDSSLNWDGIWEAKSRSARRRLVGRDPHPLQDHLLPARADRLGPEHRADHRPQDGDHPPLRHDPATATSSNPNEAASPPGHRGRQAGPGHHLQALRPGQRRQGQPRLVRVRTATSTAASTSTRASPPTWSAVVSYNMDFAETEADERRINLTRFPMFFPEKRMFFLEGLRELQLQLERQLHAFLQPHRRALPGHPGPGPAGDQGLRQDRRHQPDRPRRPDAGHDRRRTRPARPQPAGRPRDPEHLRPEQGRLHLHQRQPDGRAELAGRVRLQLLLVQVPGRQEPHAGRLGASTTGTSRRRAATTASASGPTTRTTSGTSSRPTPTTARPSIPAWAT